MAWGKKKKELEDEDYLDEEEELQDKEDIQDEDDEYDEDYEDDYYYGDEPRRNPLKGVVIALVILALLLGAVGALLYMRLQTAEAKVSELSSALSETKTELSRAQAQAAATPVPEQATPAPMGTPAPTAEPVQTTPAPTATPEPTPEPTPTPPALLKDSITNDMLGGAVRPKDESWFDTARTGKVVNAWVLALHWGPGPGYYENLALNADDVVEMLAKENDWVLIRTANDQYRWANSFYLQEIDPTPAPAGGDNTI